MSENTTEPIRPLSMTDAEWRQRLSPEEYAVLRQGATERPFTGEHLQPREAGTYACRACGAELFTAGSQFLAHCGWPAFYEASSSDAVRLIEDRSLGMKRVEVRCASCDSHLGHVFSGEGYPTPTDDRYCINSITLEHRG